MEKLSPLIPEIMGNEEETGLLIKDAGDDGRPRTTLGQDFCTKMVGFIPEKLLLPNNVYDCLPGLTANGFRLYVGSSMDGDSVNPERATPECSNPTELATYIRAGEMMMQGMLAGYVGARADQTDQPAEARWHRRVVDSRMTGNGCHDNYNVAADDTRQLRNNPHLFLYQATAGLVTGAGLVAPNGFHLTQKMSTVARLDGKFHGSSMFEEYVQEHANRFEVRCSDINISEWAVRNRIGSMAMMLALVQSGSLDDITIPKFTSFGSQKVFIINQDALIGDVADGLELSKHQMFGLNYQLRIAERMLDTLPLITDVPDVYYRIALERHTFLEDLLKVIRGDKAGIAKLADRADWAAKFAMILHHKQRDESYGLDRTATDYQARSHDLKYDQIHISAEPGKPAVVKKGLAYKMRDRGLFKASVAESKVEEAMVRPPSTTRAALRIDIFNNYLTGDSDWNLLNFLDNKAKAVMEMIELEPLQTELTIDQLIAIEPYRRP